MDTFPNLCIIFYSLYTAAAIFFIRHLQQPRRVFAKWRKLPKKCIHTNAKRIRTAKITSLGIFPANSVYKKTRNRKEVSAGFLRICRECSHVCTFRRTRNFNLRLESPGGVNSFEVLHYATPPNQGVASAHKLFRILKKSLWLFKGTDN